MKMKFGCGLLLLAMSVALAEPPQAIRHVTLDENVVVTVAVATNRVTTISFPGPISAIDAAGVTTDEKTPGEFQLAHTKGSSFLSIRALARKAATNLNIRWNEHTYVFELEESDEPVLALDLESPAEPETVPAAPLLTPSQLLGLLDKAKAFPLLKQQHPKAVAPFRNRRAKKVQHGGNDQKVSKSGAVWSEGWSAQPRLSQRGFVYQGISDTVRTDSG